MPRALSESALLSHIGKLPHGKATYKQLVKEFRAGVDERPKLDRLLDRLTAKGYLVELRSGHFIVAGSSHEYAVGKVSVHRDGYGFLVPDHAVPGISGDVFLPPEEAAKVMHGDRVVAHLSRPSREGKVEGEVVRILRRAHTTVVGEFRITKHGCFVVPSDERLTQWIEIAEGGELPPHVPNVDRVGAAVSVPSSVEDMEGRIVNVEMLEFPEDGDGGVGRVIEVLGFPGDFGIDVEIVIRKHHLPHEFPPAALDEAKRVPLAIEESELARRRDFRKFPIVTIDGETARDFDDAVHVEHLPNGNFALQVHIADVSYYVQPGSAIDSEAVNRGTSVYFPDRAVPMLPLELSTNICSLRPHEDRLVLSALLELDHTGAVVAQDFCRGVIRSSERMTYTAVHRILEGDASVRAQYTAHADHFERMRELALILNRRRTKRGSIDFDMPETNIVFDMEGQMTGVARAERTMAHRIIEEFMLAANEAVAGHLETAGIPSLYRIHEQPDPKRIAAFEDIAASFGYSLGIGAIPVKRFPVIQRGRDGKKTRRDVTIPRDEFKISSRNYQKLIAQVAGKPEERILNYLMLRSLKQARYSSKNDGHFALAANSYTHFTSPIRRYPDLVVHRILCHYLDDRTGLLSETELHQLGDDCSFTERRAAEAERELLEWKKVRFMEDRVGEEFDGLIISTTKFGFFVELFEIFIEGLVPIDSLPGDSYHYHEPTKQIIGARTRRAFSIGDEVRVRLDRADTIERRLNFAIADEGAAHKRKRQKRQRG